MHSAVDDPNFASAIERVFQHSKECTDVLRHTNRARQHDMESISDAILDYIRHMEIEIGLAFDSAIERDIYDHGEMPSEEVRRLPTYWQKRVEMGKYFQSILKKEMDFDKELLRQSLIRNQYVPISFSKRMACLLSMYTLVNGAYCFVRDVSYDNIFWEFILDYICFRVDLIIAFLGNSKVEDASSEETTTTLTGSKLSMNATEALYEQASYSLFLWKVSRQLDYSWCHNRPLLLLNRQLMDKAVLLRQRFQRIWPSIPTEMDNTSLSLLDNLYGPTKENNFFGAKSEATLEGLGSVLDKLIESSRVNPLNISGQRTVQSRLSTRPLPPSLIPNFGYSDPEYRSLFKDCQSDSLKVMLSKLDGNNAQNEDSDMDLKRILQSELIWMYPPYPSLRLLWMPEGRRRGESSTVGSFCFYGDEMRDADERIIKVFKDQAFTMPLPPDTERQVLHVLQYSLFGDKDREKIPKRKKANGTKIDAALDSLLAKSAEARARRIVLQSNLSPKTLSMLVECNPLIATECLSMLLSPFHLDCPLTLNEKEVSTSLTLSEKEKNEYLIALTAMDMTLHSMEVVNRLATQPAPSGKKTDTNKPLLHSEYLHLYLSHCISSCENIHDSNHQTRLVRLVCVFLQSLIQSNVINFGDLLVEIQAFCVQYSRIREASSLFKFIKSLE